MLEEQRELKRKPVALSVTLGTEDKDARPCKVRDLSLNGVFVECDQTNLSKDNSVELSIAIGKGKQEIRHRVPARVTRISKDGAALSFRKVDMDTFSSILELLYVSKQ
ncbi:MAG: PilZ domain-containing protein [Gammaproteobacteria bacterium]|nr:PilZ domain-containing protein [Gammaproteobacteria bacterium]